MTSPPLPGEPGGFEAPWWARGPHAQTLLARTLRRPMDTGMTRTRLETPDGDFVDVDWGRDVAPDAPVALVLHGLEGSSRRGYVRNVCGELARRGVTPVAMNFRGCSGEPNRTLRFYHSGETEDVAFVLEAVRRRYPDRALGAMGFSLGGNVLLKLLGESGAGGRARMDAAAAMSVPYDLAAGCAELEKGVMGRVYAEYFLRSLRRKVDAKRRELSGVLDLEAVARARTVREFDDRVTAPLHGFDSAAEYYAASSSAAFLPDIRVPTLLVHAVDDPFLPPRAIPRQAVRKNPDLTLRLEPRGGHVGFVDGTPRRPRFWADEAVAAFLASRLGARHSGTFEAS